VGSAPVGWEVPCISRPQRRKYGGTETGAAKFGGGGGQVAWSGRSIGRGSRKSAGKSVPGLASVSEDLVRDAMGGTGDEDSGEAAGGWVEDLNGLLGFNKGFRGRYVDHGDEHEDE
jgi:hypothetical protein